MRPNAMIAERETPREQAVVAEADTASGDDVQVYRGDHEPSDATTASSAAQLEDLHGEALIEALIERDSNLVYAQDPNVSFENSFALRAIRRKYREDAARVDGVYEFMRNRGVLKRVSN
jgi:hypothetical protein